MNANAIRNEGDGTRLPGTEGRSGCESVFRIEAVEPWPEPVEGVALLDGLAELAGRFVVLPRWGAETVALWILHTYAFPLRDTTTYLGLESPEKRCGKTTLLTLLSRFVNRPVVASNISPPAFFRVIEEVEPTLLIDEGDTVLYGNEELRGILNAGYKKQTAFVVRVAAGQGSTAAGVAGPSLARYSCWCPKAIAVIGRLPETLSDRCIVLRMQRKTSKEECQRLRDLPESGLARQCGRFVQDHARAIVEARPELPAGLHDRAADVWEPLFALADLAGGRWPTLAREAALTLTAAAEEQSPIGCLFLDILVMFVLVRRDRAFTRELVDGLNAYGERPWKELRHGKALDALWLAQQLRRYGIKPRTLWIGDEHAKGYLEEDFREAFRRYIPAGELEALKAEAEETRRHAELAEKEKASRAAGEDEQHLLEEEVGQRSHPTAKRARACLERLLARHSGTLEAKSDGDQRGMD